MKKILMTIMALVPLTLWAQDNTWEQPEEDEQEQTAKKPEKVNPDQKYLKGAVPLVDGKVVFSTTIEAPGKRASDIYHILLSYMQRMTREKNQLNSQLVLTDSVNYQLGGAYEEWLVFTSNLISLDRTRLYFVVQANCHDGRADITLSHIRYLYDEERKPKNLRAEEWITDEEAVNKKNTRLLPFSGKFRRKTIDRKDYLFNKFQTLLK